MKPVLKKMPDGAICANVRSSMNITSRYGSTAVLISYLATAQSTSRPSRRWKGLYGPTLNVGLVAAVDGMNAHLGRTVKLQSLEMNWPATCGPHTLPRHGCGSP